MPREKIEKPKLIAVEGNDEVEFFNVLLKHLGFDGSDFQIENLEGKGNYNYEIPALINKPGFNKVTAFLIIHDADKSDEDAFKKIVNIFERLSKDLEPPKQKDTFSDGNPRIGIFIMPGNANEGMLEDLCLKTVEDHPVMECVNGFINCISELKNHSREMQQKRLIL